MYNKKEHYIFLYKLKTAREQLENQRKTTKIFKDQIFTITRETLEICCPEIKEALCEMITILANSYSYLLKSGYLAVVLKFRA